MTTQALNPNLFMYWKDLYDQFEKTWTQPMHEMLGSESFVASMSATRDSYLTSQKAQREGLEQYLESLHVPTKSDFTRLAGQVILLESKLEALEDRFDGLESKLDTFENRFDSLESKLDALMLVITKLAATPSAPAIAPSIDEAPEAAILSADEASEAVVTQLATKRNRNK